MNSIESVLNMIATEAAEMAPLESSGSSMSFRFDLELIEDEKRWKFEVEQQAVCEGDAVVRWFTWRRVR